MIQVSLLCAVLAGIYGVVHDQISFTISPEYFTHIKFRQFGYADFGLHPRILVAEIGFLATWWVGFAGGWLLARTGIAKSSLTKDNLATALTITGAGAITFGVLGALLGWMLSYADLSIWSGWRQTLDPDEVMRLIIVACLHWGSYFGGFFGLLVASLYLRRVKGCMGEEIADNLRQHS